MPPNLVFRIWYVFWAFGVFLMNMLVYFAGTTSVWQEAHLIWIGPAAAPISISTKRSVDLDLGELVGIHSVHRQGVNELVTSGATEDENFGVLDPRSPQDNPYNSTGLDHNAFMKVFLWNVCKGEISSFGDPPTIRSTIDQCSSPQFGKTQNIGQNVGDEMPDMGPKVDQIETISESGLIYITFAIAMGFSAFTFLLALIAAVLDKLALFRAFWGVTAAIAAICFIVCAAGITNVAVRVTAAINVEKRLGVEARFGVVWSSLAWVAVLLEGSLAAWSIFRALKGSDDSGPPPPLPDEEKSPAPPAGSTPPTAPTPAS